MADMSAFLKDAVIQFFLRNNADTYTPPTTIYASLHSADPGITGASEVVGGSYARQAVTFTDPAGTGDTANNAALTFTGMPAGDVAGVGLWDLASGGNCFFSEVLTGGTQTLPSGATFEIATGDLDVNIT